MRTILLAAIASVALIPAQPLPSFDVASIKPAHPRENPDGTTRSEVYSPSPGTFAATNASLDECIRWAYLLKEYQVSGPDWLSSHDVIFDIAAKSPPETTTQQVRLMVQNLLAERFKLAVHRETRKLPILALRVGKNGPKLHETAMPPDRRSFSSGGGRMTLRGITMPELANQLSREMGRVVQDQTEIKGVFDITLAYAPDPGNDSAGRASIFTAVQEQVGLKLESTQGPVEMLVIDHVEKVPTEN